MSLVAYLRSSSRARALWVAGCALASLTLAGCKVFSTTCAEDDRTCLNGGIFARSGQACIRTGDCAVGLNCVEGVCEYAGDSKQGAECVATAECGKGLYCSAGTLCEPISDSAQGEGGPCGTSADCKKGLACDADVSSLFTEGPFDQLSADCQAMLSMPGELPEACQLPKQCVKRGVGDTGTTCKTSADCLAGLYCAEFEDPIEKKVVKQCIGLTMPLEQEPITVPSWDGAECPADEESPTAYFEVPRGDGDKDFYRLPFPNDIRKKGGKVDLTGHPVPPADTGVPVVERFVDAANGALDGFGTNAVVYFRFSEPVDAGSSSLSGTSLRIIDISKGSPTYDQPASIQWSPSGLNSNYICPNWLALRRPLGQPLRPRTTYAAIMTRQVKTAKGQSYARSPDLDAMLASNAPSNSALSSAYAAYAPLRAWIADSGFDAGSILNAAVFTTQDPESALPALREAIAADGAPELKDMVVCKSGVTSPCDDGMGRGACSAENDDFVEIHGKVSLPIFQLGTPPYEKPEDGGAIAFDASGKAMVQSHMDVCFAMSVPKAAAPAGGYPVMLYGHGTGGSFSGQMGSGGLAKDVATAATPGVLLAIDMPEHGTRRGSSTRAPEDLFFNILNPEGARGNVLQGAADMMSLALLVQQGGLDAQSSPTGDAVPFDATRVVMFGHSQGATHTALALPFEGSVQGGVLSGVGGHLATSLLSKQKPVDIGAIMPFVLFDADSKGKLVGGTYNPALMLLQTFFESADPINYAQHAMRNPTSSAPNGHHLFMTYGLQDSYSPELTQDAYAVAASLPVVAPLLTGLDAPVVSPPLSGNATFGTVKRTVGMRQYDPTNAGVDGHFVSTTEGRSDVVRFVEQILSGEMPEIGQ